ncbi:MAG TPA: potassium channel protein [Acidobacteriota bacterium]|nr:potassium channel protein [Acidobacteriota bacterium]
MDYISKSSLALIYLVVLLAMGTIGYHFIENNVGFFDAFYMTVITISTVGFGELKGLTAASRPLTVLLIFMGIGLISFTFYTVAQAIVEGELRRILGRRKLDKRIRALRDHVIICGYGRVGEMTAKMMSSYGKKYVVIERNQERLKDLEESGHLFIMGDATDDTVLELAGVGCAKGLIAATHPDPQNIFIVLTARELNPKLKIHCRAYEDEAKKRLERAGADKVIYPDRIGGFRLAMSFIRPSFVNFIDVLARSYEEGEISVDEVTVGQNCLYNGKSLMDADLRQRYNLIILAIGMNDGTMHFNPGRDTIINEGETLLAIGTRSDLNAFAREFDALELKE